MTYPDAADRPRPESAGGDENPSPPEAAMKPAPEVRPPLPWWERFLRALLRALGSTTD